MSENRYTIEAEIRRRFGDLEVVDATKPLRITVGKLPRRFADKIVTDRGIGLNDPERAKWCEIAVGCMMDVDSNNPLITKTVSYVDRVDPGDGERKVFRYVHPAATVRVIAAFEGSKDHGAEAVMLMPPPPSRKLPTKREDDRDYEKNRRPTRQTAKRRGTMTGASRSNIDAYIRSGKGMVQMSREGVPA